MEINLADQIGERTVLIHGRAVNGLGDLSIAHKVANVFCKHGQIPAEQIVIATNSPKQFRNIFDPKGIYRVISFEEIQEVNKIALAVVAPYVIKYDSQKLYLYRGGFPTLFLSEYGFKTNEPPEVVKHITAHHLLGFDGSREGLGFLLNPVKQNEQKKPLDPAVAKLIDKHKLYLGYASEVKSKTAFVKAICAADIEEKRDLAFVIPGNMHLPEDFSPLGVGKIRMFERFATNPNKKPSCADQFWRMLGYPQPPYDIVEYKSEEITLSKSGKEVFILFGSFTNEELQPLWKTSEKSVLATGDGSLSEAISASKHLLYEARKHKKENAAFLKKSQHHTLCFYENSENVVEKMRHAVITARKDDYTTVDKDNEKLWDTSSCNQKIINKAEELLARTKNATYPLDYTKRNAAYLKDKLKPGQLAIIHRDQLKDLTFIPKTEEWIDYGDHRLITRK